jgi:hypothetical protein
MTPAPDGGSATSGEHVRHSGIASEIPLLPGRRGAVSRDRSISRTPAAAMFDE